MQKPDLSLERDLWESGVARIAGLDEAGRGAWAGPVAAAAVTLPEDLSILEELDGVRDSKQMTARQRWRWEGEIKEKAVGWGVGFASNYEIDLHGIVPATRLAMQRALEAVGIKVGYLLLDAIVLPGLPIEQRSIKKGDCKSLSIAAASVLAKVARDRWMIEEAEVRFPGYGFARHKGYGTRHHRTALGEVGPCDLHRLTFRPLRSG